MDYYLLTAEGKQAGPYSLEQIKALWRSGQITLDTPCWTNGTGWKPIRTLESKLNPAPVMPPPPRQAPPVQYVAAEPERKWGCGKVLGAAGLGCMGVAGLCFLLLVFFVASLPPESPEHKRERQIEDASSKQGFDAGLRLATSRYAPGYPDPSEEECSELARRLLASDDYKNFQGSREYFISGFTSGYQLGWKEAKEDYVKGR